MAKKETEMNILIIGSARSGKDTVAEFMKKYFGLVYESSSEAALRIFLFDRLKKHGLNYSSRKEAFEDRVNHRELWFNEISAYNSKDPAKLAKKIMATNDVYVGMRSEIELEQCRVDGVFDLILGVVNYRLPLEDYSSNTIDVNKHADVIITNNGSLKDLENKVISLGAILN